MRFSDYFTLRTQALSPIGVAAAFGMGVIAVGKGKRLEDGKIVPLDVKVGDRVLLGKYSGSDIKVDGLEYLIVREDEVLGVLDGAAKLAKAS